jgi:serine/threonine-protein kinase RsbW
MNNAISIRCNPDNLKHIREFVKNTLNPYHLSDIALNQMILAVDEICANLIIHANNKDESKFLHLKISRQKGFFLFELVDHGLFFDMSSYKEPDIQENIRKKRPGGMGIAIVKRIMDKVEFTSNGTKNVCRLYKRVNPDGRL